MRFQNIALAILATKATTTSVPSSEISEETISRAGTMKEPQDAPQEEERGDEEVYEEGGKQWCKLLRVMK